MGISLQMDFKTFAVFLLLVTLSWSQNTHYSSFDWRPTKIHRQTSPIPYQAEATTVNYDSRYYDTVVPYNQPSGYFPASFGPYQGDSAPDSYSADYQKNIPYHHPDDSGSYEQYGYTSSGDTFNMTVERYGGFGGTGDTRGFGAYDYPKKVHDDVHQDLHHDAKGKNLADLADLSIYARDRIYHRGNPGRVHPLPPPL